MTRRSALALLIACAAAAGCAAVSVPQQATSPPAPAPTASAESPAASTPATPPALALGQSPIGKTERAKVVRVVDGDTIVVDRGRGREKLRYIGVDTPETVKPNTPVQFMGEEAAAANRAMVARRTVYLERDITEHDQYGRLLRYVWVKDASTPSGWLLVNLALVAEGYAQVVTYPPDVRYVDAYLDAQRVARDRGLGLWSTEPSAAPAGGRGLVGNPRAACDPAYPTVCIAPPPPDLDCRDVPFRRFRVLPPDPHRFDLDFNGVGCEGA